MKKTIKYLFYSTLGLLLTFVTLALLVFNSATFQTYITSKVASYLSSQFKTKITIDHIKYIPFTGFAIDNIYWGDQKNDTLFYVDELKFNFGGFNKRNLKLTLNDVIVDGAYCKMVTYPDSTFNIDVLFNILDPNDTIPDTISPPFQLYFNRVACHNARYKLVDSTSVFETNGFDGLNEDYTNIETLVSSFWIIKDSLHFDLKKLTCKERSGLEVTQASTIATICSKAMLFDSLSLSTKYSHVSNSFHMYYTSWKDMSDFNHLVKIKAQVQNSNIDMRDLQHFSDALIGNTQKFEVSGKATGTVDNLKLKQLQIAFGNNSVFKGSGTINGLPNIDETFVDVKAQSLTTNKTDIERLVLLDLPNEIKQLGNMNFKGAYTGFFNDFVAYGVFETALGKITTDLNMKLGNSEKVPSYSGKLAMTNFNMGKLIGQSSIGKTSLLAEVKGKGFSIKDLESSINTKVDYFEANNYTYKHIALGGEIEHKMFSGKFDMKDENAEVHFNGTIDLNTQIPQYKFKASIDFADLKALHFDTSNLVLSSDIDIDFAIKNIDENEGQINITNTLFIKNGIDYPINQISLKSVTNGENKKLTLTADMMSASIEGKYLFEQLPNTFSHILHNLLPNYISEPKVVTQKNQHFSYKVGIDDSRVLTDLFLPQWYVNNVTINGDLNSIKSEFNIEGSIDELNWNDLKLANIITKNELTATTGNCDLYIQNTYYKDSLLIKEFNLNNSIENNNITTNINIKDSSSIAYADIGVVTTFSNQNIEWQFQQASTFTYKNKTFDINPSSLIVYQYLLEKTILQEVEISHHNEQIAVDGFFTNLANYNFIVRIKDMDLSIANLFTTGLNINFGGMANGKIIVKNDSKGIDLNTFLSINNLSLDNDTIGSFSVITNFDESQNRLISQAKSVNGKLNNLELSGYMDLQKKPYAINYNLFFNESEIRSFQAFVKDEITIYSGTASAKCSITGNVDAIDVNGNININQVLARVEYLKTIYAFNSKINFTRNTITINPFQLVDIAGKQAKVEGVIRHKSFHNFVYDISMTELNGFQVLNTQSKDNSLFYGTAYATGHLAVTGPQDDITIDANFKSARGTVFSIPLSSSDESDGDNLINFVNKDTTLKSVNLRAKSTLLGFGINMFLTVTPDAQIQLVFDEVLDDKIIGRGKGPLKIELTKQGQFNMFGEVAIEEGEYKFTAIDVFTRKFLLKKGGTITWTGDPLQARMNIEGVYKVRNTSVADLITTATEQQKEAARQQRVPIECILRLKGYLLNPEISFDLNFPDNTALIGNNVSALENSLRRLRSEPELMQQQVVSLMLFGQFAPTQGLGQNPANSNINSGFNNTLSDLISAQANNLISRVIPGFNISADYQTAVNAAQNSKAIVTASKKFLNERLEVQTSFDVLSFGGSSPTGQVLGQYSLRPDGNLKLRGFNRTSVNPIYSKNITSQGMGLYYRREFDTFSELLRKKNNAKKINP